MLLASLLVASAVSPSLHAADDYPWIPTAYYNIMKDVGDYTPADASFMATRFEKMSGKLYAWTDEIRTANPDAVVLGFVGVAYISEAEANHLATFFSQNPQYTEAQKESVYLHYKCDTIVNGELFKGCNRKSPDSVECWGYAAPECSAWGSSALSLSESRVPDGVNYEYQLRGWKVPNLNDVYADYGVWRIQMLYNYWTDPAFKPDGMWWDNVLAIPGYAPLVNRTIEYWDPAENVDNATALHPRARDYMEYYLDVTSRAESAIGRVGDFFWLGNVNGMYWIRTLPLNDASPFTQWVLDNLPHFSPESWVSPIQRGEYWMPVWIIDCKDLREAWNYTVDHANEMWVSAYNHPFEGAYDDPDQRTKIFSIAKFYLVKNPRLYYAYSEDFYAEDIRSQWNAMAEVNIGMPRANPQGVVDFEGLQNTDKFFDWNRPSQQGDCTWYDQTNVVMARHFTNGLVIARWKGNRGSGWWSEEDLAFNNSYVDPREYQLSNPFMPANGYYVVQPDGTLSAQPVTSVTLATNEAALLLNACGEGEVPEGSACGCGGQIINGGSQTWCCSGQPKTVCDSDLSCELSGGGGGDAGYVCVNPNSCQAECIEVTPTPSPTPTPTPEACSPEGEVRDCEVASCAGVQVCADGFWGECVKNDLCCGVNCDDGNSCTADSCNPANGECSHADTCGGNGGGNGGGGGGGYYGGGSGGYYATPTPSPKTTPTPVPPSTAPPPVTFIGLPETNEEVEDALLELPAEDPETLETRQIISEAREFEKQGKYEEAKVLWKKARERVAAMLTKARANRTSYNYWLAGFAALAIIAGALYYSSTLRKPRPPAEAEPPRVQEHEVVLVPPLPAEESPDLRQSV